MSSNGVFVKLVLGGLLAAASGFFIMSSAGTTNTERLKDGANGALYGTGVYLAYASLGVSSLAYAQAVVSK